MQRLKYHQNSWKISCIKIQNENINKRISLQIDKNKKDAELKV
jgi:hypothetical protein